MKIIPKIASISFSVNKMYTISKDENLNYVNGGVEVEIPPFDERFHMSILTTYAVGKDTFKDNLISDRSTYVVKSFSRRWLEQFLDEIMQDCASDTQEEVLLKLMRYFEYEYEDR